jgi:hypothetical protein
VLNLLDQNDRLNPLNLHTELPRHRMLVASVRLSFQRSTFFGVRRQAQRDTALQRKHTLTKETSPLRGRFLFRFERAEQACSGCGTLRPSLSRKTACFPARVRLLSPGMTIAK